MRSRTLVALSCAGAVACANILGIDDGAPRTADGSVDGAEPDASGDAPTDVGPDGTFSPLSCGTTTCNFTKGEACCRTGSSTFGCVDAAAACQGTLIPCDRPVHCPSGDAGQEECCTTDVLTDAGAYVATSVSCMPKGQCAPIPTHYILCGDNSSVECGDATCAQSVATLPTFLICK